MMAFCDTAFALSISLIPLCVFQLRRHCDALITLAFVLVPITNPGICCGSGRRAGDQVEQKTVRMVEMHDKSILGMFAMRESRDGAIVRESMGKQFDASLENCYRSARPELERFYRSLE